MPLFFILSGFFTAMLWKKRGAKALVSHRFRRILLPCMLGAITLVPLCNLAIGNASAESGKRRAKAALKLPPEDNLWSAIRHRRADALRVHLDKGFECSELHPEYRTTALSWAAIVGDLECVDLLLDRGCDPSIANPDGNTPLHAAMFLGHHQVAEHLIDRRADTNKKNNNGETPVDSLRSELAFVEWIAGVLVLDVKIDDVRSGRKKIEEELIKRNLIDPNAPKAQPKKTTADLLKGLGAFLRFYPEFSYLWFLWFLWWYAVGFVFLAWVLSSIRHFWTSNPVRWRSLKLYSPLAITFWIALTLFPISRMTALGFLFGPDTSVGFFPDWHVFAYYAVFFLFGVGYYLSEDNQARLGSNWRWLLPLTMLVVFPVALEINLGTFGFRDAWIPSRWIVPLSVLSQSIFAWWMSLACMGMFRSCLNEQKPWVRYLSDSSYWLYVAHLPLVIVLQTLIANSSLDGFSKLLLISVLSIAVLLLTYQLLVRHSWIGRFLNGPRAKHS